MQWITQNEQKSQRKADKNNLFQFDNFHRVNRCGVSEFNSNH